MLQSDIIKMMHSFFIRMHFVWLAQLSINYLIVKTISSPVKCKHLQGRRYCQLFLLLHVNKCFIDTNVQQWPGRSKLKIGGRGGGGYTYRKSYCLCLTLQKKKQKKFPFFLGGGGRVSEQNINSTLRVQHLSFSLLHIKNGYITNDLFCCIQFDLSNGRTNGNLFQITHVVEI